MTLPQLLILTLCTLFSVQLVAAQADDATRVKKPKMARKGDPYKNALILDYRGKHTILPQGGVIFMPDTLKDRLVKSPKGAFQIWPKFYRSNPSWIWTVEISLDQAKGLKPISEKKLESYKTMGKIIVATYKKNPISILPPKKEDPTKP